MVLSILTATLLCPLAAFFTIFIVMSGVSISTYHNISKGYTYMYIGDVVAHSIHEKLGLQLNAGIPVRPL